MKYGKVIFFIIFSLFLFLFNYQYWFIFKPIINFDSSEVFIDLKFLLRGIDIFRAGLNPYLIPYNPPFNYPSFWKYLAFFDIINQTNKNTIACFIILSSLAFYLRIIGVLYTCKQQLFYFLLLISPLSLLIFERCNSDLIIFCLLLLPLIFSKNKYFIGAAIILCVFLKIFPIGALFVILGFKYTSKKQIVGYILFLLLPIFIYLIINYKEIALISKTTPYSLDRLSFGITIILKFILNRLSIEHYYLYIIWFYIGLMIFLFFKIHNKIQKKYALNDLVVILEDKKYLLFLLGSGIFIFSELVAINWEYRMFFCYLKNG